MPVDCNSCAVVDHHADLVDVLGTCHSPEDDTSLDAAGVEVEVRSPYLRKMRLKDVVGKVVDLDVP